MCLVYGLSSAKSVMTNSLLSSRRFTVRVNGAETLARPIAKPAVLPCIPRFWLIVGDIQSFRTTNSGLMGSTTISFSIRTWSQSEPYTNLYVPGSATSIVCDHRVSNSLMGIGTSVLTGVEG